LTTSNKNTEEKLRGLGSIKQCFVYKTWNERSRRSKSYE